MTFCYTNQRSARRMFYHDHCYGITRLNVYVGEAAGYLLMDPVERVLIGGGTIPVTMPTGLTTSADYPVSLSWTTNPAVRTQSVNFTVN